MSRIDRSSVSGMPASRSGSTPMSRPLLENGEFAELFDARISALVPAGALEGVA